MPVPEMDPAVIHHDDVVASERRNQAVFDIGEEHLSGHGTFDHHRGDGAYHLMILRQNVLRTVEIEGLSD